MTGSSNATRHLARWLVGATAAMTLALGGNVAVSADGATQADRLTVTYDEDEFLASNRIRVTQTFDHSTEFPPAKRTVAFQGIKFRSTDTADPYWRVDGGLYRGFSGDGPDTPAIGVAITFRNRGAVRAFGFLLDVFGSPNQFVIRVVETDGHVTRLWLPADTGDTYIGLHSQIGIAKVVIVQRFEVAGGATNFAIDDVSRSYIVRRCFRRHR